MGCVTEPEEKKKQASEGRKALSLIHILNKVASRTIDVRRAHAGEKIVTLDEKEFTLNPNNLVICDAEKPVALAGIMGLSLIHI